MGRNTTLTAPHHNPDPDEPIAGTPSVARRLWEWIERPGFGNWLFGPRSFGGRGSRIQVYGCSPGCLLLMLALSILLTLLVNAIQGWLA